MIEYSVQDNVNSPHIHHASSHRPTAERYSVLPVMEEDHRLADRRRDSAEQADVQAIQERTLNFRQARPIDDDDDDDDDEEEGRGSEQRTRRKEHGTEQSRRERRERSVSSGSSDVIWVESPDVSIARPPPRQDRRQERMRGAGTHEIAKKNVGFPAPSPSVASSDRAPLSATPNQSTSAGKSRSSSSAGKARKSSSTGKARQHSSSTPDTVRRPALATIAERLQARLFQDSQDGGASRRPMAPVKKKKPKIKRLAYAKVHEISEAAWGALESRRKEDSGGATVQVATTSNVEPSDRSRSESNSVTPSTAGQSSSVSNSSGQVEGVLGLDGRRQERMRGAGTHSIAPQQVQFPEPSPSVATNSMASSPAESSIAQRPIPRLDERRQERVRGAGTHQIQTKHVNFPAASPSTTSLSINTPAAPPARPAGPAPRLDDRRQERMRGAGTHRVAAQQVSFPDPSPSTASTSMTGTPAVSSAQQQGPLPRLEDRRQERMRGAGTHVINSQKVTFPVPSPSTTFATESISTPIAGPAPPRAPMPTLEERRQERMRGAGTHAIQQHQVGFPDPSPVSSAMQSHTPQAMPANPSGSASPSSYQVMPDPGFSAFDDSMLDPRLRNAYTTDGSGMQPHATQGQPMESTPGLAKNVRMSVAGPYVGFSSMSKRRSTQGTQDGAAPTKKARGPVGRIRKKPRPGDMLPDMSKYIEPPKQKRKRGRPAMPRDPMDPKRRPGRPKKVRADVPADVQDDQGDITMRERARARPTQIHPAVPPALPKPVPLWFVPKGNQPLAEQKAARAEFKDLISLAMGDRVSRVNSMRPNDADVIYTLIKREFQKAASSPLGAPFADFLEAILARLIVTFRRLSEQAAERRKLIEKVAEARRKKLNLRKLTFLKRSHVLRVMRAVDGLHQEQLRRARKAIHESEMSTFLQDLRQSSHAWSEEQSVST